MQEMLKITGIRKAFGGNEVLRGVDLTVCRGEVVALIGPSGSGKTTLLRCANFLERADAGTMTFDGRDYDLAHARPREVNELRRHTGFVFQNYNLFRNKTALQNVTEGLITARRVPKAQAEQTARRALARVGMDSRADSYPAQLSGGQQQRVAIARALCADPEVLFADEPTGNLDSNSGREVMELLRDVNARLNKTVVVITHDSRVAALACRRLEMCDGTLREVEV